MGFCYLREEKKWLQRKKEAEISLLQRDSFEKYKEIQKAK